MTSRVKVIGRVRQQKIIPLSDEIDLWKQIDPNHFIKPWILPKTHRIAIVWAMYQMLRISKEFLDHTLLNFTNGMGFFIGMSTRTSLNLAVKAGMRAIASESDPFLMHIVHLLLDNLTPDIRAQANGVVKFLRTEASKLQNIKKIRDRLNTLVKVFEALYHKLDDKRQHAVPYEIPPELDDLFLAIENHHLTMKHQKQNRQKH